MRVSNGENQEATSSLANLGGEGAEAVSRGLAIPGQKLEQVLESLPKDEKYNTVLQGLANMVALPSDSSKSQEESLKDMFALIEEMKEQEVKLSEKSLVSILDASAASQEPTRDISKVMAQMRAAQRVRLFSRDLTSLTLLPRDPGAAKALLEKLPPVPLDDRKEEVNAALVVLAVTFTDLFWRVWSFLSGQDDFFNKVGPDLLVLAVGGLLAFQFTSGSGEFVKQAAAGLQRLFTRDVERECNSQAASLLTAYLLGLPCYPFNPNVLEAMRLLKKPPADMEDAVEGNQAWWQGLLAPTAEPAENMTTMGIHRILVWLMASVAAESANHPTLLVSNPRQAYAFLNLIREKGVADPIVAETPEEDEGRVQWALEEARQLLEKEMFALEALKQRMETGAASVGECVMLMEKGV
eukprot:CAMPEP_0113948138 /NCGR_PEP_ID=MMETSP1339-20121228/68690_1 /TAXON_ID=94617 /ORGANISM="Fibrocapsa japonica" /LENGTH=410 /DNA_ID=CAMNT_0000955061 /DNA_START=176 /DNA_END=1408 /DNA_ORIENTATION=- /assembly_acc=CAM_ASM_000762